MTKSGGVQWSLVKNESIWTQHQSPTGLGGGGKSIVSWCELIAFPTLTVNSELAAFPTRAQPYSHMTLPFTQGKFAINSQVFGGWEQGLYCPLIPTRIWQNLANSGNSAESDLAEGPAKLEFRSGRMQTRIGIFLECKIE